jgi:hypothetical protein
MLRLGPRKNMVGVPKTLLSWTKKKSGLQGNVFLGEVSMDLVVGF